MYISFILGEPRFRKLHQTKYLTLEGVPAKGLDSMAFNRSWSHLVHNEGYDKADFIDPNSGTFRMRLHEQTIKGLLIEEVFARPSWFINSKSNLILELYEKFLKFLNGFKALVIIAIVTTAALIAIYRRELTAQYGREAFACVCIAPFFSSLPYVIAYPRFPVDFFIVNTISIIVICGICLAALYLRATRTFLDLQSRL
ncbi:hypothetical protein OBA45_01190 [bacterium]|nr:hypothetical protein [bacterium]